MQKLIVAKGRSVLVGHKQYVEGADISEVVSREIGQAHIDAGFAVIVDSDAPAPVANTVPKDTSAKLWGMDPDGLVGIPLDKLNLMVGERDPAMKPFETPEEAIAQLSSEFVPLAPLSNTPV